MTDKPTLYSLTDEMSALYQALMDEMGEDGELPPDSPTVTALAESEQAWMVKARNVAFVAERLKREAASEKDYADRFRKRAQAMDNAARRLREYLLEQMVAADRPKVEVEPFRLSVTKSPASLEITDEDKIPAVYKVVTTSTDKERVKAALKQGEDVPGARLITDNTHLRIR